MDCLSRSSPEKNSPDGDFHFRLILHCVKRTCDGTTFHASFVSQGAFHRRYGGLIILGRSASPVAKSSLTSSF